MHRGSSCCAGLKRPGWRNSWRTGATGGSRCSSRAPSCVIAASTPRYSGLAVTFRLHSKANRPTASSPSCGGGWRRLTIYRGHRVGFRWRGGEARAGDARGAAGGHGWKLEESPHLKRRGGRRRRTDRARGSLERVACRGAEFSPVAGSPCSGSRRPPGDGVFAERPARLGGSLPDPPTPSQDWHQAPSPGGRRLPTDGDARCGGGHVRFPTAEARRGSCPPGGGAPRRCASRSSCGR